MTAALRITIAYAAPGIETILSVAVAAGATVRDAVDASGLSLRDPASGECLQFAIFGQRAAADTPLRDGDRIELTRALVVDPKDARRVRARRVLP